MASPFVEQPLRSELQAAVDYFEQAKRISCGTPGDLQVVGGSLIALLAAVGAVGSTALEENGALSMADLVKDDIERTVKYMREDLPDVVADLREGQSLMYRSQRYAAE